MRAYLKYLVVIVTLLVAGCGTTPDPWRTPGGGSLDNLPDYGSQISATDTPINTEDVASGRAAPTPYYTVQNPTQQAATISRATIRELPPVKVAILLPLSGTNAALGQGMLNAAQMAVFNVGAHNVILVPRDTAAGASKAAQEAVNDGAQIILGPLFAQDVKAASAVADRANIPVIAFSTDWTAAGRNTYIMGFLPFGQISRVMDFATQRGARRVAILTPQTPYGMAVNVTLKNELARRNLVPVQTHVFSTASDLGTAIQKIGAAQKANSPDAPDTLVLPVGGAQLNDVASLLRQNDVGMRTMRLIGTGLWDESPQAQSLVPGGWYAAPDPNLRAAFNRQYAQTYGAAPPRLATLAYDAAALAAALAVNGLRQTGKPAFDNANITNPNGFAGLDGIFRFRPDHLAERGLAVLELRPNGPVIIDRAPTRF